MDWAGSPAQIIDPDTGEITKAWLFVGVMTYSQYPYVEAFLNEKQQAWITAHVHMYEYFGGVTRILVPDNCKTAVIHTNDWYNQQVNTVYRNIFITSATGSGKTYMACAFGMEACKQRYKTKYVRLPDLLLELDMARSE